MTFFIISFVAGILTVLAPCVLPLLPVIIGGSISTSRKSRPFIVVLSLSISVILFTLLLKVSTAFISIPPQVWTWISGIILVAFGLAMVFPDVYEKALAKFNLILGRKGNQLIYEGVKKESIKGDILIGAALGPVFSTCSPTYFVILATVLPQSFAKGFLYLVAYTLGLSLVLLLISVLGQKFVGKLEGASNPHGTFKKVIGALFILVGIFIISGLDKKIQTWVILSGVLDITKVELRLLDVTPATGGLVIGENNNEVPDIKNSIDVEKIIALKNKKFARYAEIKDPAGFVNSSAFKLSDYVGKKVIMLDFMTYSCINCQRTYPYLAKWYETYEDDGLLIVGIHTPEFAFEKKIENVEAAMKQFGLKFPVVLDNDYGTWNNYGNNVWPRKYIIDIDGFVVYDHKGEGGYDETEEKIRELLKERSERLNVEVDKEKEVASTIKAGTNYARSPETYFGSLRNERLANGQVGVSGEMRFENPDRISTNYLYLEGTWNINPEFAKAVSNSKVIFKYNASKIFIVASGDQEGEIKVYKDDSLVRTIKVKEAKLYTLIDEKDPDSATLRLEVSPGVELYAFTFG